MDATTRRKTIKAEAKQLLNRNFKFYLVLFLPIFILQLVTFGSNFADGVLNSNFEQSNLAWIISIVLSLLMVGVSFVLIDLERGVTELKEPVSKSFTIFNSWDYFIGTLALTILIGIMTMLWSFLLLVPGIIKGYSYSQAIYIYRDYLDQGQKIGFMEAITLSREMMDGHKWEMFVLQLSFIGWALLCILILPILGVEPYYQQTMANFYVKLSMEAAEADEESDPEEPVVVTPSTDEQTPSSDAGSQPSSDDTDSQAATPTDKPDDDETPKQE
ncbi:DUF975 family protein [Secundilactobacillus similis DSM 23365 = JCM 2765]